MSSATNFYLTALDNDINVMKALIEAEDASQDTNANPKAVAKLNVHVADVQNIFRFATNAVDLTDISAEDIHFFVDADGFRDLPVSTDAYSVTVNGNPLAGSISDQPLVDQIGSAYVYDVKNTDLATKQGLNFENDVKGYEYSVDNKGMIKDLFRDLANQMFNTQYGVDLFSNETDLCNNVFSNTSALFQTNGNIWQKLQDASGMHIGSSTPDNIGKVLLENIVQNRPERLVDISTAEYAAIESLQTDGNAAGSGAAGGNNSEMREYKMPFMIGDAIHFHLTYKYAADQSSVLNGSTTYNDRIYEVVLMIVA